MLVQGFLLLIFVEILSCQRPVDCRTVRCAQRFCPDGSLALIPPGKAGNLSFNLSCQKGGLVYKQGFLLSRLDGPFLISRKSRKAGGGGGRVKKTFAEEIKFIPCSPGQCCPDPSLCRGRCRDRCIFRVCIDGSVPPTPPGKCCPDFSLCPEDISLIKFGKYY